MWENDTGVWSGGKGRITRICGRNIPGYGVEGRKGSLGYVEERYQGMGLR